MLKDEAAADHVATCFILSLRHMNHIETNWDKQQKRIITNHENIDTYDI